MNKVILSGNLTQDPEVRYSQSGTAFAKTGIAVRRPYSKNSDNTTDFFNLTVFGKQAEFCGRYLKKGISVIVEGKIQNDNYEDKNGVKHYRVDVIVDNIEFAGNKRSGGESSGNGGGNYGNNSGGSNYDNGTEDVDVPF